MQNITGELRTVLNGPEKWVGNSEKGKNTKRHH